MNTEHAARSVRSAVFRCRLTLHDGRLGCPPLLCTGTVFVVTPVLVQGVVCAAHVRPVLHRGSQQGQLPSLDRNRCTAPLRSTMVLNVGLVLELYYG